MGLMNCYREPFLGTALRGFAVGLANLFGVVAKTKQIHKSQGRRKSALLQDAPLKLPPDWRNWLTPIAVFLLSVFTDDSDSPISICDEDTDMISEILHCTIVH